MQAKTSKGEKEVVYVEWNANNMQEDEPRDKTDTSLVAWLHRIHGIRYRRWGNLRNLCR